MIRYTLLVRLALLFALLWSAVGASADSQSVWADHSPHRSLFAHVNGVNLNYLDWGGRGTTMLFLAGWGDSAHIFDDLAPTSGASTTCWR